MKTNPIGLPSVRPEVQIGIGRRLLAFVGRANHRLLLGKLVVFRSRSAIDSLPRHYLSLVR